MNVGAKCIASLKRRVAMNLGGTARLPLVPVLWTGGFCLYICHCEKGALPDEAISL